MNKVFNYLTNSGYNSHVPEVTKILYGSVWSIFKKETNSNKLCLTNDRAPQVCVSYFCLHVNDKKHETYEISIVNENSLGWVDIKFYGLSEDDVLNRYDEYEKSLIKAWESSWGDK